MVSDRWVWRGDAGPDLAALRDVSVATTGRHGEFVARLLWNRGVRDATSAAAFLSPTLARGLRSPILMRDMERATERLAAAIACGERVGVYGGGDIDGIAATAMLVLCLRALGATPLVFVPDGGRGGGAVSKEPFESFGTAEVRVVVIADYGTAAHAPLAVAADLGLDVIVCSHRPLPVGQPPAFAVLNPMRSDCEFPFKGLSGSGIVFYLLMGVRMALRARGRQEFPDLRDYLDLVTVGTVADVAPLREENRVLVTHGLRQIDRAPRPGMAALKDSALLEWVSVQDIALRLVPRLAANGYGGDVRMVVELLTTESADRARALAVQLEILNAERRALAESILADADAFVGSDGGANRTLFVAGDRWHPGAINVVAARLAERHQRCVVVIALEGERGYGCGYGVGGVDVHAALTECGNVLDTLDGHRHTVVFTVGRARLGELRKLFEASVQRRTAVAGFPPPLAFDAEISLAELTPGLVAALGRLAPHGPGNPEVTLLVRSAEVVGARAVGDADRPHLKLRLKQDSRTVGAIAFDHGRAAVHVGMRIDAICAPRLARWDGRERLELGVRALRRSQPGDVTQQAEKEGEYVIP